MKIPNIKEIEKPVWASKPGFGMGKKDGKRVHLKQDVWEQGTTPKDKELLKKLGIKKGDKILAIAGYYATWASALNRAGAKVDYSDVSKPIVEYVKKNVKVKFRKYICLGYEHIPKKPLEYDWTFTYEACGGGRGLPIAYLRSLLNKKGGILVLHFSNKKHTLANSNKIKRYPLIVKRLAKVYGAKSQVVKKKIIARRKTDQVMVHEFLISKILTNNSARKRVELDIKVLWFTKGKKIINLEKDSKRLRISKNELKASLRRLSMLSKSHNGDLVREIVVKQSQKI